MAKNKKKKKKSQNLTSAQKLNALISNPNIPMTTKRQEFGKWFVSELNKLPLSDLNVRENKTYTNYTKENYRSYMANPKTNETKIRNMSRFLYRVSGPYRRLINYYADIPLFYWNLMPVINTQSPPDTNRLLKQYHSLLTKLTNMNLAQEMRPVLQRALIDGVFYGIIYEDKNSFFIQGLDSEYCKIQEIEDGCFNFAFNLAYFDKNKTKLDYWDPMFKEMYDLYRTDTTNYKWQMVDNKRSICIKFDPSNLDENLPAFVGIFEGLIDLIDARTLQRAKDEIENYKLILQKIPYFKDTDDVDDFALEIDTAMQFYNRLLDVVPSSVGVALSPMEVDTVDFKPDDNSNDLLANSMRSVFDDSGTSQMLFNGERSGSVGLDASIKTDVAYVWRLVEMIERWIRRYIKYNTSSIKFDFEILRVDIFNHDKAVELQLKLASSGVPNKLKLAATSGISPLQSISNQYFENEILQLHESWKPLQTSYTQSAGRPAAEDPSDSTATNIDLNGNQNTV